MKSTRVVLLCVGLTGYLVGCGGAGVEQAETEVVSPSSAPAPDAQKVEMGVLAAPPTQRPEPNANPTQEEASIRSSRYSDEIMPRPDPKVPQKVDPLNYRFDAWTVTGQLSLTKELQAEFANYFKRWHGPESKVREPLLKMAKLEEGKYREAVQMMLDGEYYVDTLDLGANLFQPSDYWHGKNPDQGLYFYFKPASISDLKEHPRYWVVDVQTYDVKQGSGEAGDLLNETTRVVIDLEKRYSSTDTKLPLNAWVVQEVGMGGTPILLSFYPARVDVDEDGTQENVWMIMGEWARKPLRAIVRAVGGGT